MPSKFFNKKISLMGGYFILLGVSALIVSNSATTSIANSDAVVSTKYIDPYVNYLSLYIPDDDLKKVTPSGMNLWEVLFQAEEVYEYGEVPMILQDILIVNKDFGISKDFNNYGIDKEANEMFEKMKNDAKREGIYLNGFSIYRSYDRQVVLYNKYVSRDGQALADTYSAKPGFSEHQTGLAFDICGPDSSLAASTRFNNTKEARWLKDNAYKYGFILRYPEGCEDETGYIYESWHYRYVGIENSSKIFNSNVSLEKYFGLNEISKLKNNLPKTQI